MSAEKPVGSLLDQDAPLPFEELLTPLVLAACEALCSQTPASIHRLLAPGANAGWERYLLVRLARAGAKAMHWHFQVFRTVSSAFPVSRSAMGEQSDAVYRVFVSHPETRLQRLFGEFPALKRLTDTLIFNWLSAVGQFLERVTSDAEGLAQAFGQGRPLGLVTSITAGLSDPHRGGQCVAKAVFEDGTTLVYKPRPLAAEAHFARLLEWLNTQDIPHPLRPVRCWDRGEYGWMEYVPMGACVSVEEIHAFYWRAGALLCLYSLADGVDMHFENLIAAGAHPVLVDLETLWHPQEAVGNRSGTSLNAILRTGFLPQTAPAGEGGYEWSALSRAGPSGGTTSGGTNLNRDDIAWTTWRNSWPGKTHLPEHAGQLCPASHFVGDLVAGFRWIHRWLSGSHHARSEFVGWIQALAKCPRRRVLRSSVHYHRIHERLTSPRTLRDLRVPWQEWHEAEHFLPAEIQALECLDVPHIMQPRAEKGFSVEDLEEKLSARNFLEHERTIERALA